MRAILLLFATTIMTRCRVLNIGTSTGCEGVQKTRRSKLTRIEDVNTETNGYGTHIDNSNFETSSERGVGRVNLRSDIILTDGKVLNDVETGDRTKRQVWKGNSSTHSVWNDGVYYTFNISGWFE
uniref:Secreted protein n=1 Tax=Angiostrongylus cantonensis TaxID=6313 RepID=A0A0K0CZK3_ANGCA